MNKRLIFFLFLLPLRVISLEKEPWFGNLFELEGDLSYCYSRYNEVQNAQPSLKQPSNDQLVSLGVGFPFLQQWALDTEFELARTPRFAWGLRSFALQMRYLWLDDLLGDPISLSSSFILREVTTRSLKDVSCPYQANTNVEVTSTIGKEWSDLGLWKVRSFAFFGVGIANRGSPWIDLHLAVQGNSHDKHQYELFVESNLGFGKHSSIDIKHFDGYASIKHRSIDLGVSYSYLMSLWGSISFLYERRVFARSFPEHVNFFTFSYQLPFSIF